MSKTQIDYLLEYKNKIINSSDTIQEKNYLLKAFTRWFFNVKKDDVKPLKNIVDFQEIKIINNKNKFKINVKKLHDISSKAYKELIKNFPDKDIKYIKYDRSLITDWQYKRLVKLHNKHNNNNKKNLQNDIAKIINLYNFIGMNTQHLSIPPIFTGFEMFGTPLNTHNEEFCSPFNIDKKFGSFGSVWDYKFHKDGIYFCDPPYDPLLIENIAIKINKDLDNTKFNVAVLYVIPVWDSETQQQLKITDYGLTYTGFDIIKNSKYFTDRTVLDKDKYKYWSYYDNTKIGAVATHYILLTKNYKIDLQDYVKAWEAWSNSNDTI